MAVLEHEEKAMLARLEVLTVTHGLDALDEGHAHTKRWQLRGCDGREAVVLEGSLDSLLLQYEQLSGNNDA